MCRRAGRTENELKDGLHSLRASCLRSFPEFIADIRLAANGKGGEFSTGLHEVTSTVRTFGYSDLSGVIISFHSAFLYRPSSI